MGSAISTGNPNEDGASDEAPAPLAMLADTWWYGLTKRFGEERFVGLAKQRKSEGFSAIQLVVGVPPEVGPEHPEAASLQGTAWTRNGEPNPAYLRLARERLEVLIDEGLRPVVYGAWGHQLDWIGAEALSTWWEQIVDTVDDLDVVYCLGGELDLWLDGAHRLWPDLSTDSATPLAQRLSQTIAAKRRLHRIARHLRLSTTTSFHDELLAKRRAGWDLVLQRVFARTQRPILAHSTDSRMGTATVDTPELLAAQTVQTGHTEASRDAIWRLPLAHASASTQQPFLNLECWYEGITGRFFGDDQLYAYWVSMLAGATGHVYGAQGIWNGGDGCFLSHWGKQSFDEARHLATPARLGEAHQLFMEHGLLAGRPHAQLDRGRLVYVERQTERHRVRFFPDSCRLQID